MSGLPPLKASIARSADHKIFITEAEKAITKIAPEVTGNNLLIPLQLVGKSLLSLLLMFLTVVCAVWPPINIGGFFYVIFKGIIKRIKC